MEVGGRGSPPKPGGLPSPERRVKSSLAPPLCGSARRSLDTGATATSSARTHFQRTHSSRQDERPPARDDAPGFKLCVLCVGRTKEASVRTHRQVPTARYPPPGTHRQVPTARYPPPGTHRQVPSARYPAPGTHRQDDRREHRERATMLTAPTGSPLAKARVQSIAMAGESSPSVGSTKVLDR